MNPGSFENPVKPKGYRKATKFRADRPPLYLRDPSDERQLWLRPRNFVTTIANKTPR